MMPVDECGWQRLLSPSRVAGYGAPWLRRPYWKVLVQRDGMVRKWDHREITIEICCWGRWLTRLARGSGHCGSPRRGAKPLWDCVTPLRAKSLLLSQSWGDEIRQSVEGEFGLVRVNQRRISSDLVDENTVQETVPNFLYDRGCTSTLQKAKQRPRARRPGFGFRRCVCCGNTAISTPIQPMAMMRCRAKLPSCM